MPEPIDFGTQVCSHCGVLEIFHDREHVATECLPKQMEKLQAKLGEAEGLAEMHCGMRVKAEARVAEQEERFKTVGEAAMEASLLGSMERLLDPLAGNGAVRLSQILVAWHEATTRVTELEAWKESAMEVMNGIDLQAVGKELGIKLGEPIGPAILPGIRDLKLRLSSWRDSAQQHGE